MGSRIPALLNNAGRICGKLDFKPEATPFPEEANIPQGSQDDETTTVTLAVESRATLVTTDRPLREALNSTGIQERYGFLVMSPEEALRSL